MSVLDITSGADRVLRQAVSILHAGDRSLLSLLDDIPAPLYVTDKTLKWWVASCRVGKSYKVGNALYIQARCSNEGSRQSISVKLDLVNRDRLAVTWDGGKIPDMRRCK